MVRGVLRNTIESEKESDDSEIKEGSRGSPEEPEGDQWTPVTHKRLSPRKLSSPTMQRLTIKTHNALGKPSLKKYFFF